MYKKLTGVILIALIGSIVLTNCAKKDSDSEKIVSAKDKKKQAEEKAKDKEGDKGTKEDPKDVKDPKDAKALKEGQKTDKDKMVGGITCKGTVKRKDKEDVAVGSNIIIDVEKAYSVGKGGQVVIFNDEKTKEVIAFQVSGDRVPIFGAIAATKIDGDQELSIKGSLRSILNFNYENTDKGTSINVSCEPVDKNVIISKIERKNKDSKVSHKWNCIDLVEKTSAGETDVLSGSGEISKTLIEEKDKKRLVFNAKSTAENANPNISLDLKSDSNKLIARSDSGGHFISIKIKSGSDQTAWHCKAMDGSSAKETKE